MLKKIQLTFIACPLAIFSFGQSVIPAKNLKLPKDSLALIAGLNGFVEKRTGADPDLFIETTALLDEMKGQTFTLINVSPVDSSGYLVQMANGLRAGFKLMAKKANGGFVFSSPLRRNTLTWKKQQTGSFTIYRNTATSVPLLDRYIRMAKFFDQKLKAPDYPTEIFYCDSFSDVMALLGEEFRVEYNGYGSLNNSWYEKGHSLMLIGAATNDLAAFDLHDLWHTRLHHMVSTAIINRPIDEACAYLYGGSWGVYTWPDILREFKAYMGTDRDWLKAFDEHRKFGGAKTPLYTDYVLDALIVQQIEKEQGFAKVIEFLSCGKKQDDNANYFQSLSKITGITRANFNSRLDELLKN
jgi:hypothetical protein